MAQENDNEDVEKDKFSRRDFLHNSLAVATGALLQSGLSNTSAVDISNLQGVEGRAKTLIAEEIRSNGDDGLTLTSATSKPNSNIDFKTGGTKPKNIRMRITRAGRVGIGTDKPSEKFHVLGTIKIDDGTNYGLIGNDTPPDDETSFAVRSYGLSAAEPIKLQQQIGPHSHDRLTVDPQGNIGIGTTAPRAKLDVTGNIRVDDGSGKPGINRVWTTQKVYNVLDYGAVSDYLWREDASVGIQAAIDAASSNDDGGIVYIPPGGYRIDKSIILKKKIQLVGAGVSSWLNGSNCRDDDGRQVAVITTEKVDTHGSNDPGVWTLKAERISVKDLAIQNYDIDNQVSTGISLRGAMVCVIENVCVRNFRTGIQIAGWANYIVNCWTDNCYTGIDLSWPAELAGTPENATNAVNVIGGHVGAYSKNDQKDAPLVPPNSSVLNGSWDGTRVTIGTNSDHRLQYGAAATISGCSNTTFNGDYRDVVVKSATEFTAIPDLSPDSGIVSGTWDGSRVTLVTLSRIRLQNGTEVRISGCSNTSYNGKYRDVVVKSANEFSAIPDGFKPNGSVNPSSVNNGVVIASNIVMPTGSANNGTVTGRIIGVFINGLQNSLFGTTIERGPFKKEELDSATAYETVGVYIRNCNIWGWYSPTLINGCYFEYWKHTFALDGNPEASIIGCVYHYWHGEPVKSYGIAGEKNIVFLGNAYGSEGNPDGKGFQHNWFAGKLGIGQAKPTAIGVGTDAKLHIQAPWSDWIFLGQEQNGNQTGGYHIANPLGGTDQPEGDISRNRLEFAYKTASGEDKWGQLVLHGPSGNVGINTTAPETRLDVRGTATCDHIKLREMHQNDFKDQKPAPGTIIWNGTNLYVWDGYGFRRLSHSGYENP